MSSSAPQICNSKPAGLHINSTLHFLTSTTMIQSNSKREPLPFRWPGGKFYALKILRPFWLAVEHDEYREPFVGGGSIFFSKRKVRFNWLNDIDSALITTYRVMSDK